ncbi:MAG: lasso peptide biosynthesis PqqD family chaperone [Bacteroidales bacterium]|nr:lasso peptide biosynthesis PqqD family chaperone [Bacteroidales bacterium]
MGILSKKNEITPDTVLQRKPELLFNEIDGEVVMLSIENGEYYGMDKVGSRIWELLEQPIKMNELTNILICEFEVSNQQCVEESLEFLSKLYEKKLIITK